MITLNQGLTNSLEVLKILKKDKDLKDKDIYVRGFHNGRETGLTFTVRSNKKPYDTITYCVYEHRNSDSIIVNSKKNWTAFNGELPYKADSKWIYDASFSYGDYEGCAKFLKKKLNLKKYKE